MTNGPLFICCGIFREELEALKAAGRLDNDVVFLDPGLHVNFGRLRKTLKATLDEYAGRDVRVVYGQCLPDMAQLLDRYGVRRLDAGNCLEAFVGSETIERLNRDGAAFFLTAGWVNNLDRIFAEGEQDLGVDFRTLFDNYKRIIVFDTGVIPLDDAKIEAFASATGLPVERVAITLDAFLDRIRDLGRTTVDDGP